MNNFELGLSLQELMSIFNEHIMLTVNVQWWNYRQKIIFYFVDTSLGTKLWVKVFLICMIHLKQDCNQFSEAFRKYLVVI